MILRKATLKDAPLLLAWRNDSVTRSMSLNQTEVTPEAHAKWMDTVLCDPKRHLYLAQRQKSWRTPRLVGTGRLDGTEPGWATVSYTVAPEYRGYGYGEEIVNLLCEEAKRLGYTHLLAEVNSENLASLVSLLHARFTFYPIKWLELRKYL